MKAQMTKVEQWYAIKAHAEAILRYAERQTGYEAKPDDDWQRVSYRAKRIKIVADMIGGE